MPMKRIYKCSLSTLSAVALVMGGCSQSANSDDKPAAPAGGAPAAPATATAVDVGSVAPEFALEDQNNKIHRLADYKGKTVVLAFYPADMTGGCSLEARNLTKALPEFEKRGVQLFGVSVQDVKSKKAFCDKDGIKYSLLADVEKKTSADYGVLAGGYSKRVSFIIGPNGRVVAVDRNVRPASVADDTLKLVDASQAEAKTVAAGGGSPASQSAKIEIDKPVFSFKLPNYDGKETEVGAWDKSKATVILYIATKCPISNAYNGRMADIAKAYSAKGIRFVGINSNKAELSPEIADHAKANKFGFPVLKDTGNIIADRFEAKVTPEVFVVDSAGILRYHGRIDNDKDIKAVNTSELKTALDELLAGKPVTTKTSPAFGCSIKRVEAV